MAADRTDTTAMKKCYDKTDGFRPRALQIREERGDLVSGVGGDGALSGEGLHSVCWFGGDDELVAEEDGERDCG